MHKSLFLISLALSSAACSQNVEDDRDLASADASDTATKARPEPPKPPAVPSTNPAKAVNFVDNSEQDGGQRAFAYSWPAEVARIPELAARFEAERDKELAEQKAQWRQSLVDFAGEDCVTCKSLGYEVEWKTVADLPDFLSLSSNVYLYTGGAHGMHGVRSLVWDKKAGAEIEGGSFFKSNVTLETALGAKLCDALDRERAKRRGTPVVRNGEWSTDCPSLDDATILVGSSNGENFDRIGIYFGPYTAGSYAEGAYELNFPVTASVIDAVKPKYAGAFRVKR